MKFIEACYSGNFDEAVRLYNLGEDIHSKNDRAFRSSCIKGKFKIAK